MRRLETRGAVVVECEHRPELASAPLGKVTFDGGRRGTHEGGGWVRVYGLGEHYGFVNS